MNGQDGLPMSAASFSLYFRLFLSLTASSQRSPTLLAHRHHPRGEGEWRRPREGAKTFPPAASASYGPRRRAFVACFPSLSPCRSPRKHRLVLLWLLVLPYIVRSTRSTTCVWSLADQPPCCHPVFSPTQLPDQASWTLVNPSLAVPQGDRGLRPVCAADRRTSLL